MPPQFSKRIFHHVPSNKKASPSERLRLQPVWLLSHPDLTARPCSPSVPTPPRSSTHRTSLCPTVTLRNCSKQIHSKHLNRIYRSSAGKVLYHAKSCSFAASVGANCFCFCPHPCSSIKTNDNERGWSVHLAEVFL